MENERSISNEKYVIKRDGRKKPYEVSAIRNAVKKAYEECYLSNEQFNEKIGHIITEVNQKVYGRDEKEIDIEDIQDYVVEALDKVDKVVGKAYEEYREKRNEDRIKHGFLSWH